MGFTIVPSGTSSTPVSDLPALPTDDGDYALRVAGGVGSWVRTPLFQTVGVSDGTNDVVLANDPFDATRGFLDAPLRVFASVLTNDFFASGGGYTIIDDNGDQHPVAFLDSGESPTALIFGQTEAPTALHSVLVGSGVGLVAGAGAGFPVNVDDGRISLDAEDGLFGLIAGDVDVRAGTFNFGIGDLPDDPFINDPNFVMTPDATSLGSNVATFAISAGGQIDIATQLASGAAVRLTPDGELVLAPVGDMALTALSEIAFGSPARFNDTILDSTGSQGTLGQVLLSQGPLPVVWGVN